MTAYTDALLRLQMAATSLIFNAVERDTCVLVQLDDYAALVDAADEALKAEKKEQPWQMQLLKEAS